MKSNQKKPFINSEDPDWKTVDNGVQRKVLGHDEEVMMVHIRFKKGAVGSPHHHVHRQVSYVESGRFEVTIDGKKNILKQGDSFFVSPNLVHGVVAVEEGSLLDVFVSASMDFIQ